MTTTNDTTGLPPLDVEALEAARGWAQATYGIASRDALSEMCREALLLRSDGIQEALRVAVNLAEREMFSGSALLLRTLLVEGEDDD